jgi:hypothetical protein
LVNFYLLEQDLPNLLLGFERSSSTGLKCPQVEPWVKFGSESIDESDKSLDDWAKGGEMGEVQYKAGLKVLNYHEVNKGEEASREKDSRNMIGCCLTIRSYGKAT